MKLKTGKQIPNAANKLAVVMGGDEEFFMKTGGDDRLGRIRKVAKSRLLTSY